MVFWKCVTRALAALVAYFPLLVGTVTPGPAAVYVAYPRVSYVCLQENRRVGLPKRGATPPRGRRAR